MTPRVVVIEGSGRGFLCQYAHALALGLLQLGSDVTLIMGRRDELAQFPVGIPKEKCNLPGLWGWLCLTLRMVTLRPDIVHIQWVDRPFIALLFVKFVQGLGAKVVYTPHNILPHRLRWLSAPFYRHLYHAVDQVVARDINIAWGLEELLALPERSIRHIPGSPNLMAHPDVQGDGLIELPDKQDGEVRLLFFGHGSVRKGLGAVLQEIAKEAWPDNVHLVIAGEGVSRGVSEESMAQAARALRISVIDRYVPPRSVSTLFRGADALLMPYQKQCKSPLLDLACSFCVPVLKTDRVEGARFDEGRHGRTVPHDQLDQFVGILMNWAMTPAPIQTMSKHLRGMASLEQSCRDLAQRHAALYSDLAGDCAQTGSERGKANAAAEM